MKMKTFCGPFRVPWTLDTVLAVPNGEAVPDYERAKWARKSKTETYSNSLYSSHTTMIFKPTFPFCREIVSLGSSVSEWTEHRTQAD